MRKTWLAPLFAAGGNLAEQTIGGGLGHASGRGLAIGKNGHGFGRAVSFQAEQAKELHPDAAEPAHPQWRLDPAKAGAGEILQAPQGQSGDVGGQ